jgi:uncharacterized protein (TIGR02231 family)
MAGFSGVAVPAAAAETEPLIRSSLMRAQAKSAPSMIMAGSLGDSVADLLLEPQVQASRAGGVPEPSPPPLEPAEQWLVFERLVLARRWLGRRRGGLEVASGHSIPRRLTDAARQLECMAAPDGAADPRECRGVHDHRFDADASTDVPSSALPIRVQLQAASSEARPTFRTNPGRVAEVYREMDVDNPFSAPLLAGPVDVFLDGALLRTSQISGVGRGGVMRFGLGVEERLRVARNVRAQESEKGLLGGTTQVRHTVSIEVSSALGVPAKVVVLDRIPITDDKEIEVKLVDSHPRAESYDQSDRHDPVRGGLRWEVEVGPGQEDAVRFTYDVVLPSKREVRGGNRRD